MRALHLQRKKKLGPQEEFYKRVKDLLIQKLTVKRHMLKNKGKKEMRYLDLTILQNWFASKCDGNWEHCYGFSLGNLDNPGWCLEVSGENNKIPINYKYENEKDDNDWIHIISSQTEFKGYCSNNKLDELFEFFQTWIDKKYFIS